MLNVLNNDDRSAHAGDVFGEQRYRHAKVETLAALIAQRASPWSIDERLSEFYRDRLQRIPASVSVIRGGGKHGQTGILWGHEEARLDRLMDGAIKGLRKSIGIKARKRIRAAEGIPAGDPHKGLAAMGGPTAEDIWKVVAVMQAEMGNRAGHESSPQESQESTGYDGPLSKQQNRGATEIIDQKSASSDGALSNVHAATRIYLDSLENCLGLRDELEDVRRRKALLDPGWKDSLRAIRIAIETQTGLLRQTALLMDGVSETMNLNAQIAREERAKVDEELDRGNSPDKIRGGIFFGVVVLMIVNARMYNMPFAPLLAWAAKAGVDLAIPKVKDEPEAGVR